MKALRKYIDVFIGLGAAFLVLSILIAVLFFAFPVPEGNSYIGGILAILLAVFFLGGLFMFVTGVFLEVGGKKDQQKPKE